MKNRDQHVARVRAVGTGALALAAILCLVACAPEPR